MRSRNWIVVMLYVLFGVYFLFDVYNTQLLLRVGAVEINPALSWGVDRWGTSFLWCVKSFLLAFFGSTPGLAVWRCTYDGQTKGS